MNYMWLDQYGEPIWAHTLKELKVKAGPGKVSKMYQDKLSGGVVHVGYVIGSRWFTKYQPVEIPV